MSRRRINYRNLIILIVSIIVIISLIFYGIFLIFKTEENKPVQNQEVVEKVETYTIDMMDYEVFNMKDFDFNFVLLKLRLRDTKELNASLSDIYTSEGIKLSSYQEYVNKLEKEYYYLGTKNVSFNLKSDKNDEIFNIFVPYKDKSLKELTIIDAKSKKEIKIDLKSKNVDSETLRLHTGEDVVKQEYTLAVKDAYEIRGILKDDETYNYPENVQINAFVIEVKSLKDESIRLEQAIFIDDVTKEEINALDESFSCVKINNIINRDLHVGDIGVILIEKIRTKDESFKGSLKLKFSNSDEWLLLRTGA